MSNFGLQVTVRGNAVRALTAGKAEADGLVDQDGLRRLTIEVLAGWVAGTRVNDRDELRVLGGHLYRTIFKDDVEALFLSQRNAAKAVQDRLQLHLQFDDPKLADLPWEYLYYPGANSFDRGNFLATEADISIMRWTQLSEGEGSSPEPGAQPLKVLLTLAMPARSEQVDRLEKAMLEKANEHPPMVQRGAQTWPELLDYPGTPLPHVLHLVARAGQNESGRRGLALVTAEGKDAPIDDEQLVGVLRVNGWLPRLVVLQIWEESTTAGPRSGRALSSVARALMEVGVEAVVAMEYPPDSPRGLMFSTGLYKSLSEGAPIDHAVQKGRIWVWNFANKERVFFGVPVLYMNHDVQLVQAPPANGGGGERQSRRGHDPNRRDSQPNLATIRLPEPRPIEADPTPLDTPEPSPTARTSSIEPQRAEVDPAVVPLFRAATQAAKRLHLDAMASARVVDAVTGLAAEERVDWTLDRLREPEQYDHEHELLAAVSEVAITSQLVEGVVPTSPRAMNPPLAPAIRYGSAAIATLGLGGDAPAHLSRVLAGLIKDLAALSADERVDRLFTRLARPGELEPEDELLAALAEVAVVDLLEREGKAVRSASGGTDPPLATIIRQGAETIKKLDVDDAERARAIGVLADLSRELAAMDAAARVERLAELAAQTPAQDPVREVTLTLVYELEDG